MGCFPACFRHLRHNKTMKNVQNQCSSPSNESAKLLPATMESIKEEEIVNPIKFVQETDNGETAASGLNKGTNEDKLEETAKKERIENKDDVSESNFLINDKDCVAKEITFVEEESSDSLFSLSIDSRKQVFAVGIEDKEVNSPFQRSCPVLAKTGEIAASLKFDEDKENVASNNDSVIKKSYDHHQLKKRGSEIGVDTSLSSWLVVSEKSNKKTSMDSSPQSEKNYGESEIFGAEFKEMNGILSSGSTPCCSGDDHLGIGTVGGYWQRRGRAGADMGAGGVLTICTNQSMKLL